MGLALLMMLALATGADAPTPELKLEVNHWVKRLDAPELRMRTEAENKLLAIGPKILDILPQYDNHSPATEAQRREAVGRIRDQLERRVAEESTSPTRVTLRAVDRPLSEILADISAQTGNKFKDFRPQMGQTADNPTLSIVFSKTPFWQAVDTTFAKANLAPYPFAGKDEMGYKSREPNTLPTGGRISYAGPLRLEATTLTAERSLAVAGAGSLKLDIQVAWEPRLRPITLKIPLADIRATDDRGNLIAVENPESESEQTVGQGNAAVDFQLPLVNPPRTARAIGSIKGNLKVLLPGKVETFEFTNLKDARKIEQHRAGVGVFVDDVQQNGGVWQVRMRVRFENAAGALETYRSWIYNNEAYLEAAKGKIPNGGFETTSQGNNEVGVAYDFDLPNGPAGLKFVYKTPAMLSSISLPFEFKDLALP
jgi:hypothetical protein